MAAVRVHHRTLRSATFFLEEPAHRTVDGRHRGRKRRRFDIDENGDAVIALAKWHLIEAGMAAGRLTRDWILMGPAPTPPPVTLDLRNDGGTAGRATWEQKVGDVVRQISPGVDRITITDTGRYRPPIRRI